MAFTPEQALARIRLQVQADSEPTLSSDELDELVEMAKQSDSEDRVPSDADWVATWNLNLAVAEGWRWKAGKVAAEFNVLVGGNRFERAQTYQHCMKMASSYASGVVASITVSPVDRCC